MRKKQIALVAIMMICAGVMGCSRETLDSRQIDETGGLAYKHGSTEPFTGTVEFKDTIPNELQGYWTKNTAGIPGLPPVTTNLAGCEEHFTKGLVDGDATCIGTGGQPALSLHYKDELFDGPSKLYNLETGALVKDLTWSKGRLDGVVKVYTYDGKQMVNQVNWSDGSIDCSVKQWNAQGVQITDAAYKSGQIDHGTVGTDAGSVKTSTEYHDGTPNGVFTKLTDQGVVLQKGLYVDGQRSGPWEDSGLDAQNLISDINTASSILPVNYHDMIEATRVESHWIQGKVDGEMKGWDESGKPFFDLHFSNGVLDGLNQVVTRDTGSMQTFNVNAGRLVAGQASTPNASATTGQRPPDAQPSSTLDEQMKTALTGGTTLTADQMVDAGGVNGLTVTSKNADGYPIFQLECEADGHCVGPTGEAIGDITAVAAEMPAVKADDIVRLKYVCAQICKDPQGDIVGRAP
jgi:antitoxin component YwqK of YwqJK toxin-antitoxin module